MVQAAQQKLQITIYGLLDTPQLWNDGLPSNTGPATIPQRNTDRHFQDRLIYFVVCQMTRRCVRMRRQLFRLRNADEEPAVRGGPKFSRIWKSTETPRKA